MHFIERYRLKTIILFLMITKIRNKKIIQASIKIDMPKSLYLV